MFDAEAAVTTSSDSCVKKKTLLFCFILLFLVSDARQKRVKKQNVLSFARGSDFPNIPHLTSLPSTCTTLASELPSSRLSRRLLPRLRLRVASKQMLMLCLSSHANADEKNG